MFWFVVALFVFAAAYALTPKAETQNATLGTLETPTAEEGREIPVLFGTRDIKQCNVVLCTDVKTVAVKKKGGKK